MSLFVAAVLAASFDGDVGPLADYLQESAGREVAWKSTTSLEVLKDRCPGYRPPRPTTGISASMDPTTTGVLALNAVVGGAWGSVPEACAVFDELRERATARKDATRKGREKDGE